MTRASASAPVTLGDLTITEVDYQALTEDDIVALNTFDNVMEAESNPEDPPTPLDITRADVRNQPDFIALREFWAREPDGAIAGLGYDWWKKTDENRHVVWARVSVRPDRRGHGIAKALLRLIVDVAAAEGRTTMISWSSERVPSGEAFARLVGAEVGSAVHTNRLELATVERDLVRRWVEEGPGRASEYELVALDGPYPDDLVENIARVYGVMNTAPRDDLDIEDEKHTVDQIRQREQQGVAAGTQRWSIFARHRPSGELIGLSEVYWNPAQPVTIYQGDTGVHPDHRGHALGKWMKAAMLERIFAERPDVVDIRTGNADSNDAMLGINNALGFRPYIAQLNWQVPLDRVEAYLSGSST